MKKINRIIERFIEGVLTVSGAITSIVMLLIVLFLFKEGSGLFHSPSVEKGYLLYVNSKNIVTDLSTPEIKHIFDSKITNWKEVGGLDQEIEIFRFEEIFNYYSDEELGEDYVLLPEKFAEVIAAQQNIIAYLPEQYAPKEADGVKALATNTISISDFFGGKEWIPTATPAPLFGVLPLILGTLLVSFGAIIIALPLGLGVAIYLSELAGDRIPKFMKPTIELLAGIPSVVYGFFGLVVLVPIVQDSFGIPV